MFIVNALEWWYVRGFKEQIKAVGDRLMATADFFSIGLLFKTLFSPFKQISAEVMGRSLDERFRSWFDKQFSRLIGAFVRTCVIFLGLVVLALQVILSVFVLVLWLILPFFPIIGLVLWINGVSI